MVVVVTRIVSPTSSVSTISPVPNRCGCCCPRVEVDRSVVTVKIVEEEA